MFQRSHRLVWMLCLVGLFGGGSGCTTQANPTPSCGDQAQEVWDDTAGEPVLAEEEP